MSLDRSGHTPATPLEIAVTAVAASKGIAELGAVPLVASALGSVGMSLWAGSQPLPGAPALRYAGALVTAATLPITQASRTGFHLRTLRY
jgi:hypothetical protein